MAHRVPSDLPVRTLSRRLSSVVSALEFDPPDGPLTIDHLAARTGEDRATTRNLARRLEKAGWLRRVRRGLYEFVPVAAVYPAGSPWALLADIAQPYLISGLTAAREHRLTPQLATRHLIVFDATRSIPNAIAASERFRVARLRPWRLFGSSIVELDKAPVRLAGVERVLIDAIEHPAWFSGIGEAARVLHLGLPLADRDGLLAGAETWRSSSLRRRLGWWGDRVLEAGWTDDERKRLEHGLRPGVVAPLVSGGLRAGPRDSQWGVIVNVPLSAVEMEQSIR